MKKFLLIMLAAVGAGALLPACADDETGILEEVTPDPTGPDTQPPIDSGVDPDECATDNGGCDPLVTCTNNPGGRDCGRCPPGYTGTGDTACTDIDECATNNGDCDPLVECTNIPGGFTCGNCPPGYTGGGESGCVDIDECATDNGDCDALTTCTNIDGGRTCGACPAGYSGDGETGCINIDECSPNPCLNGGVCTDGVASFTCTCTSGYTGATCDVAPLPPGSCLEILNAGESTGSGDYVIDVDGDGPLSPITVYCDMTTSGGGWTLALTKNSADDADYPDLGAADTNLAALAINPAISSTSATPNAGWVNLNTFPYTNLRIAAYLDGAETYMSEDIARASLRIAWGENGYLLYNDANGYYWCTGEASYTDGGIGQVNRPDGAPADCKGHGALGSGWDFGGPGVNSGLTLCGGSASGWMYGQYGATRVHYPTAGAAQALWVR